MSIVTGPVPPYSNPPIQPEYYSPRVYEISNIDIGRTTTVTTSEDHDYVIGNLVRIHIPIDYQPRKMNEQTGIVITIPADNQVEIDIDSSTYNSYSAGVGKQIPQIAAIGDYNSGYQSSTGPIVTSINIPGSYINISPV